MQDGYYFATTPWMIGDGPQAPSDPASNIAAADDPGLRRGQIVRIAHEPDVAQDDAPLAGTDATAPVILREMDRYTPQLAVPEPQTTAVAAQIDGVDLSQLWTELSARQDSAMARIEQVFCASVARLEDRVVAGLAASMELARPHAAQNDRLDTTLTAMAQDGAAQADAAQVLWQAVDALSTKVDAMPRQSEALCRDVADIRAGLTELRVQARMIEMQLFALSRGTDNPLARPLGIEPLGAMLGDTYAS